MAGFSVGAIADLLVWERWGAYVSFWSYVGVKLCSKREKKKRRRILVGSIAKWGMIGRSALWIRPLRCFDDFATPFCEKYCYASRYDVTLEKTETYRRHCNLTLESPPYAIIDTLWLPPAWVHTFVGIALMAVEALCTWKTVNQWVSSYYHWEPGFCAISDKNTKAVGGMVCSFISRHTLFHDLDMFLSGSHLCPMTLAMTIIECRKYDYFIFLRTWTTFECRTLFSVIFTRNLCAWRVRASP